MFLTPATPHDPKWNSYLKTFLFAFNTHNTYSNLMIISFQKIVLKHFFMKMAFWHLMTPNDPIEKNETISFVEGLQLYDVHESRDPAM